MVFLGVGLRAPLTLHGFNVPKKSHRQVFEALADFLNCHMQLLAGAQGEGGEVFFERTPEEVQYQL